MPTYEYACRACEHRFEVVQSFSDAALTTCEACGGELRKVFSAAGLIFKGSGWHIKDYSSGSGGSATASPAKSPSSDTPSSSGSSDASGSSAGSSAGASSERSTPGTKPAKPAAAPAKKDPSPAKPAAAN